MRDLIRKTGVQITIAAALLFLFFLSIFIFQYVILGETFKTFYNHVLPPELPKDIPLIEGKIIKSGKSVDIYGNTSFSIEIETEQSVSEVVEYYKNEFIQSGNSKKISIQQVDTDFFVADGFFGKHSLALEIYPLGDKTKIILGVELLDD